MPSLRVDSWRVCVVAHTPDRLPLVQRLRNRGWPVVTVAPDATGPVDHHARSVWRQLRAETPDLVIALGPPWWLGRAAQARDAAIETPPARWILMPAPDRETLPSTANPAENHADGATRALLDRLARASADWIGPPTPPDAVVLPGERMGDLPGWLSALPSARPPPGRDRPTIGLVLVHHDRPRLVTRALRSIDSQTRPPDALAVVDAASRDPAARAALRNAVQALQTGPVRLRYQTSASLGAARWAGAQALDTRWLLFLDDDNVLPPAALATFATAAATNRAAIWTSWAALFTGEPPETAIPTEPAALYAPLGPMPGRIDQENALGDAGLLIRRTTFDALGGFDPDPATGAEDWDLLARAWIAGHEQRVIPSVLLHKRLSKASMSATMDRARARARVTGRLRHAGVPA
ncbi:glycosyltransferase family 2 protein [Roseospira marina]|nr:glycosyltransferase family A protein [Roseospira marina]MBB4312778.1 GT2 family glycosyltransferase [Roseospira marina]MBB5086449.1 GT2 family glycosyltransferase [Roseospira marina]